MTELSASPVTGEHMTLAEYQWHVLLKAQAQSDEWAQRAAEAKRQADLQQRMISVACQAYAMCMTAQMLSSVTGRAE